MPNSNLSQVRDELHKIVYGNSRLTSRELVAEMHVKHNNLIAKATKELVDIALVKLVSEVSKRRPSPTLVPEQADLFQHLPGSVAVPDTAENGKRVFKHTLFSDLSLDEAIEWIENHSKDHSERLERIERVREIIEQIAPFMTIDMTIADDILAAARAEEKEMVTAEQE